MEQTYLTLNDGNKIPQFGLGVFMIMGDANTEKACLEALNLGYCHIDTAHAYQNERGVGQQLKRAVFRVKKYGLRPNYGRANTAKEKLRKQLIKCLKGSM